MTLWLPVAAEHCNPPVTAVFSQFARERSLLTAYPFITGASPVQTFIYYNQVVPGFKVLDSGLFTLTKEMLQDKVFTKKDIVEYTHKYIYMVKKLGFKHPIVEVDCHVLYAFGGLKWLPSIRKMFTDAGLEDQTIFVWHNIEGQDAFDRMCKRYKRVSISKVELTEIGMPVEDYRMMLHRNKDRLRERHLHMLGEGSPSELVRHGDNFTSDSSSWNSIMLFGDCIVGGKKLASYRNKKLQAPEYVLDMISDKMSDMVNVYRHHPSYKRGSRVRTSYMRVLATGLILYVKHFDSLRLKTLDSFPGKVSDPMEAIPLIQVNHGERHARHQRK